ncbi:FAD binding domain-containing protein [Coprinopsis cinerea okayama7|uniref:FAD binding domain-containing protein n=1 Tax=Coprinopsis cinerea (strain Okayama-7 / 130 / ATCC MYA-4618 / FGSC 9003) TaxID=240176 RepID=D6RQA9_COPC7|nr:FAD binding domain-containing protein [Coprinopsis cinerea okayama7\|eukprot:XP_002910219.1 FAD binding domain-containing protein [Coprinopsis cinerea okayama7\
MRYSIVFSGIWLLLSSLPQHVSSKTSHRQCRCIYGSDCWPSDTAFNELANRVSRPLLRPSPPPLPCYSSKQEDEAACEEVKQQYTNGTWRSSQVGEMQLPNFEAYLFQNGTFDSCPLNYASSHVCGQGSVPPIGVDARTPQDIQAAVKFANKHYLRLVVKNTGHDLLGRSTGRGAFLVWTHHMKEIKVSNDFVPLGACSSERYEGITLGAGVQWSEAYRAAHEAGRTLVGGISAGGSVGAAGGCVRARALSRTLIYTRAFPRLGLDFDTSTSHPDVSTFASSHTRTLDFPNVFSRTAT